MHVEQVLGHVAPDETVASAVLARPRRDDTGSADEPELESTLSDYARGLRLAHCGAPEANGATRLAVPRKPQVTISEAIVILLTSEATPGRRA